ncbi:MAG: family 16 glycosylhydrolase [Saprospiraceae bacterium]
MRFVLKKLNILILSTILFLLYSCDKESAKPVELQSKIAVSGINLFEGNGGLTPFRVKVNLNAASKSDISFDYSTEALSATASVDFLEKKGNITLPAGVISAEIVIEVVADSIKEAEEDFKLVFSNPKNAELSQKEVVCTIRNDDTYVPSSSDGYISADSYAGYKLSWSDEFNGNSLNTADWNFDIGTGNNGWGNEESQYYTNESDNVYFRNGKLVIEAIKEKYQGKEYTSARLNTKKKREFLYGRIDIRAKLPRGQGIWPAIWMLGANIDQVSWPVCGEIDIMELLGQNPSKVYATLHHSPQGIQAQGVYNLTGGKTFSDEFHVFSLDWDLDKITILLDDKVFFTTTKSKLNANPYPFNAPFFFILNIAVGGKWPGYPNASTVFPQRMEVDYVRVFQK